MDAGEFLNQYQNDIRKLPEPGSGAADYLSSMKAEAQAVFTTILPTAAAIKRRQPQGSFRELFEEAKAYCLKEIDKVKGSGE